MFNSLTFNHLSINCLNKVKYIKIASKNCRIIQLHNQNCWLSLHIKILIYSAILISSNSKNYQIDLIITIIYPKNGISIIYLKWNDVIDSIF